MKCSVFDGLKVVELASVLAGPSVGTFLAELGARVIKIENPHTKGDTTRQWKTSGENPDAPVSSYYASANWGKEILYLDLNNDIDYQIIKQLIKECDILLINFKTGDDKRFGLDYDSLKHSNPKLIVGQITGFNNSSRPAFDIVLQAETGFISLNASEGSDGMKWPLPIVDILAAHQLKEGLLVALYQRQASGKGAHVQVSLFDAAVASLFNIGTNVTMAGGDPKSLGPLHPNIAPYGETIVTSDNQLIVLAIGTDKQFEALCTILDAPSSFLAEFSTNHQRLINRKRLGNELQQLAIRRTFDALNDGFISHNIPFGRIKTVKNVIDSLPDSYFLKENEDGIETVRLRTSIFSIRS